MTGIIDISTALAALLTTGKTAGWFAGFPAIGTIERRWAPDWQIADVQTLRIGVVPTSQETRERLSRRADTLDPVVTVALMAHIPGTSNIATATVIDPYVGLAIRVAEIIAADTLPAPASDARLISISHSLVDRDRLVGVRCFFSEITTTWRVAQDARVALPAVP